MNERIEQFATECYQAPEFDYKKFAELIVRECMELGDKALQDGKWPGDVLKEHFGVKE